MNIEFETPEAEAAFDEMAREMYNAHADALYLYLDATKRRDIIGAAMALRGVDLSGVIHIMATVLELWSGMLYEMHGGAEPDDAPLAQMVRDSVEAMTSDETDSEPTDG